MSSENTFQLGPDAENPREPLLHHPEQDLEDRKEGEPHPIIVTGNNPPPSNLPPSTGNYQGPQQPPHAYGANMGPGGPYRMNPDLANMGYPPGYYPPHYYNQGPPGPQNPRHFQDVSFDRMFPARPDMLIQNNEGMNARPQNTNFKPKAFVLHEKLGPFVTPTGPATINIDRLQPYLDYLSVRIPKELESTGYKWFQLWIWLYVSISLIPVVISYIAAYNSYTREYNFVAIPLQMIATIHWAGSIYQAYYVQQALGTEPRRKKSIAAALDGMKYYMMGLIGLIAVLIGCNFGSVVYRPGDAWAIAFAYFIFFILEAAINYYGALKIDKHIRKVERFQELIRDKLQDQEKTGIYYRYVYELLELISEEDFLYPLRTQKKEKKSSEETLKILNEGLEQINHIIEAQGAEHAA